MERGGKKKAFFVVKNVLRSTSGPYNLRSEICQVTQAAQSLGPGICKMG